MTLRTPPPPPECIRLSHPNISKIYQALLAEVDLVYMLFGLCFHRLAECSHRFDDLRRLLRRPGVGVVHLRRLHHAPA